MNKHYNYRNPIDIDEALTVAKNHKFIVENTKNKLKDMDLSDISELKNKLNESRPDKKDEDVTETPKKDEDGLEQFTTPPKNDKPYFFKNIIMFTNERDENKNKTLKKFQEAIKNTDVVLTPFIAEEINYKAYENKIVFSDDENKMTITDQSNVDTIIITRLGAQDSNACVELLKELQQWGFFILNPIDAAITASNKYETSILLERYDIPQPKFALLMKKDIENGMESLAKKLKLIYDDFSDGQNDKDQSRQFVVKILDGHGGTGVFMESGKTILATLQAMFAVKDDLELLLQRKEEADGGDIRVHVLTMRTKQYIIASMKRKKLGKDFRSNISLGAQAEKVTLTKEQQKISMDVAKISGMPWCAVDIMPLMHNSNKELGDNAVLEYNASPGTDGISAVIGKNFAKILLDSINDVNELVLEPKAIGYREFMNFKFRNTENTKYVTMEAKFDTGNGAKASTIGCENIEIKGKKIIAKIKGKKYVFDKSGESTPKVGDKEVIRNVVIVPEIKVGSRKLLNAEFALVDDRDRITPVLINRDIMRKMGYLINPNKMHTI